LLFLFLFLFLSLFLFLVLFQFLFLCRATPRCCNETPTSLLIATPKHYITSILTLSSLTIPQLSWISENQSWPLITQAKVIPNPSMPKSKTAQRCHTTFPTSIRELVPKYDHFCKCTISQTKHTLTRSLSRPRNSWRNTAMCHPRSNRSTFTEL